MVSYQICVSNRCGGPLRWFGLIRWLESSNSAPSSAVAETEQPSFRRFHVPCQYPSRAQPDGSVSTADGIEQKQPDGEEGSYVKHILGLMPASSRFTNILDANALDDRFGEAIRWVSQPVWWVSQPVLPNADFTPECSLPGP